ncbi:hypothetical protein [Hymenobacter rigui]|uniref:Uncharacterized protein n=1 Tax=Hymenobacter rigui TaxID=334424 RepID=A0A428KU97_9BACT|nr:hypothetical protein [Hymenobacter rigui]RSK50074.1 hypothetical protein EI291_05335 [Hymenobacter rigui]
MNTPEFRPTPNHQVGIITLQVSSLGHAADLNAAERVQTFLNTVGLQEAEKLLRAAAPTAAGPGQLSLTYSEAA